MPGKEPSEKILVYVTCADGEEAGRIARRAVEERLAACANVIPSVTSVFRWEGRVQSAPECLCLLKSLADCLPGLIEAIKEEHSYELPCITALPLSGGDSAYLDWIASECRRPGPGR